METRAEKPYFADVDIGFPLEGADCKTSSTSELVESMSDRE